MVWLLVILVSFALLVTWVAWRQKRYGGTTLFDRDAWSANDAQKPSYNPWGSGRPSGGKEDPS